MFVEIIQKKFLLVAATPFLEAITFNGSHSSTESHWFHWKQVPVVEAITFVGIRLSRNHCR